MKSKKYIISLFIVVISFFWFPKNHTKTILNFIGSPGVGKGTLTGKCIKELNFYSISVGNLLREIVAQGTSIGKEIESKIQKGELVPVELVIGLIETYLKKNINQLDTVILEGFPRTADQVKLLLNLLNTKFNNITLQVINLTATYDTVLQRILNRLICEKCQWSESQVLFKDKKLVCSMCGGNLVKRNDDKEETIQHRLKLYNENEKAILDAYQKAGIKISCINVENKNPQQVLTEFKEIFFTKTD